METKGHLATVGVVEYHCRGGEVYCGSTDSPLGVDGYRMGARWECTMTAFARFRPDRWLRAAEEVRP